MKKRIALLISVVLAVACAAVIMCFSVGADEIPDSSDKIGTMTVVYLRDGGTGDGHDYANAVGTLEDAYMMLDLSKDCTIVVCDVYTQISPRFTIGTPYTGSVTVTSCYGGYDYRKIGAKFEFDPFRYVCWGATTFRNIDFECSSTNMLVVGQHNPVTVAEGVTMKGTGMTGGSIAKSFCILGGYQNNQDDPPAQSDKDTNITVLSGEFIYIVPFSREVDGCSYTGTAHIKIGGTAKVSVLHGSVAYPNGSVVGDVEVEITGNSSIKNFYGVTQDTTANSYTFNWKSGTIENFYWICPNTASKQLIVEGKTKLNASPSVKAQDNYTTISGEFDLLGNVEEDGKYVVPTNPDTKTPGDDILKAPVNSKTPLPPELDIPPELDYTPPVEEDDSKGDSSQTDKTTKPAFTKAPQNDKNPDGSVQSDASADGGTNNIPIIIIISVAAAVVIAVVVIVIVKSKGKKQ